MRIGLDLDNTLIDYSAVFFRLALESHISPDIAGQGKTAIRDILRQRDGDEAWQLMQAQAYGHRISQAALFPGVLEAMRLLKKRGHSLVIVSHKTRYSALLGATGPDLRLCAQAFLEQSGIAPLADAVVFTDTREEKCASIAALQCSCFVDDLPEVFHEPGFPATCKKILFGDSVDYASLRFWPALPVLTAPEEHASGGPLGGGRNSRVRQAGGMIVKNYPEDRRERCRREWQALLWMSAHGIRCIPDALACDPLNNFTILSFIDGAPPSSDETSCNSMAEFALQLYSLREKGAAFPPAAEACFSERDIWEQLSERLKRLLSAPCEGEIRQRMHAFVRHELLSALHRLQEPPEQAPLPMSFRMPSPSDFGLHNAIRTVEGQHIFLDFEYFGLDDPVKLMADILLHPGMNLAVKYREDIVARLAAACESAGDITVRARLIRFFPLWRLKWCCILLNEFLPDAWPRRLFSAGEPYIGLEQKLLSQLDKAKKMLHGESHALS